MCIGFRSVFVGTKRAGQLARARGEDSNGHQGRSQRVRLQLVRKQSVARSQLRGERDEDSKRCESGPW
jgi:hypothetical protein